MKLTTQQKALNKLTPDQLKAATVVLSTGSVVTKVRRSSKTGQRYYGYFEGGDNLPRTFHSSCVKEIK